MIGKNITQGSFLLPWRGSLRGGCFVCLSFSFGLQDIQTASNCVNRAGFTGRASIGEVFYPDDVPVVINENIFLCQLRKEVYKASNAVPTGIRRIGAVENLRFRRDKHDVIGRFSDGGDFSRQGLDRLIHPIDICLCARKGAFISGLLLYELIGQDGGRGRQDDCDRHKGDC